MSRGQHAHASAAQEPKRDPRPMVPPELNKLIDEHGGYAAIPAASWAQWDRDSELYRKRIREGFRWSW